MGLSLLDELKQADQLSLKDKFKHVEQLLTLAYIILLSVNSMEELANEVLSAKNSVANMTNNIYEVKCL
jgi:hypothetical protein